MNDDAFVGRKLYMDSDVARVVGLRCLGRLISVKVVSEGVSTDPYSNLKLYEVDPQVGILTLTLIVYFLKTGKFTATWFGEAFYLCRQCRTEQGWR